MTRLRRGVAAAAVLPLALTGCLNSGFQPYYGDDAAAPTIDGLEFESVPGTVVGAGRGAAEARRQAKPLQVRRA